MASLKVAVRVRPFNQREIDMGAKLIVEMDSKKTRLTYNKVSGLWQSETDRDRFKDFTFDYSYWSYDETDSNYASQEQVYSDLGTDVVDSAFEGYNACVFAYGQTGSGKTFTMMGSPDCQGLIPRICKNLFNRMRAGKEKGANYRTEVSYLEIYNERVKDLLSSGSGHSLKVREHPKQGPYVQDLSKHLVMDYTNIQECMVRGNSQRTTASTNMNDVSSRSHAIFTITFVQAGFSNDMPSETVSKVHLVDLAGSERADTSGATGQRLKEGAHINKSLVTLGSVISALAELSVIQSSRSVFIPYRDSVLTWLLKDSLGGNSKTIMIAAISPADCNYGETLSTLRYANRAKNIINKPTINEDPNVKLIRELRDEISKLKALMMSDNSVIMAEPQVLAALQEKEAQEKVLTEEWAEKWRETQQILQEQRALGLRKSGLGVVLDSDIPHLVGIDDDLLSTGVTLYHLKEGETLIGSNESPSLPDIVLSGPGVLAQHCSVVLQNGVATIHPKPPAQCWLNTVLLEKPARLSQGCILLLGRTNMFRYNDPAEAAKLRRGGNKSRLNLSRLSLLSWSTTDLAASSENLNNTNEDNEIEAQRAELLKEKQSFHREQTVREQDWAHEQQTRMEALQSAEKQLQLEREQMKQNYKVQCQKLAEDWQRLEKSQQDSLVSLLNREKQLQISKDLLKKEREEIIAQVEHESSIVANLRASLADRRKLLCELILFHIDRLKNIGVEVDIPTLQVEDYDFGSSHDLDRWLEELLKHSDDAARDTLLEHKNQLSTIENDLHTRSSLLVEHEVHLTDIDLQLSDLNVKQNELLEFSASGDNSELLNLRQAIMCRPQSEIELIQQRKLSLSLNIKRPHSGDEMNIIEDLLQINNASQPNTSKTPIRSFETFHTANSDCSVGSNTSVTLGFDNAMIDSGVLLDLDRPISCTTSHPLMTPIDNCHVTNSDYTETKEGNKIILHSNNDKSTVMTSKYDTSIPHSFLRSKITHIDTNTQADVINQSPELTPDDGRPPCNTPTENIASKPLKAMHRLQQRISRQKMLIMRNLEGHCPKEQLDHQIAVLQEQQRQHVNLEKYFQRTLGSHDFPDPLINVLSSSPEADSSDGSVDLAVDPIEDEGSMLNPLQYSSVYLSNHPENGSPCSLSLTRSMPTFSGYDKDGHVVGVTGFLVRGAGKLTHVEYEVRVHVVDDSWCLLRRYSRFRDLHLTLKARYGTKVSVISFPPRQLFSSNSDSIARTRKRQLEVYLRRLLQVCSNIPGCPLYGCRDACTKLALLEFSDFFKKGIFESTKYGTS